MLAVVMLAGVAQVVHSVNSETNDKKRWRFINRQRFYVGADSIS
jgi:hypothetical protein